MELIRFVCPVISGGLVRDCKGANLLDKKVVKLQRTKNAGRNIVFGGILNIYQIVIPFLSRTAMIYFLGIEYVGLNSLFTSILQVLNLAELGVGSAMVFSMYKPIAEDDSKTICALMRLYKLYYRLIGIVVLILGLILTPFLPSLIKGDIPSGLNLYILYFLNLGTTVISYWLFAYKNCLLTAHQRADVSSKIGIGISTVKYILQFVSLIVFRSYYLYLIVNLLTQILQNILTSVIAEKYYPQYRPSGILDKTVTKEINNKVKDLFTAKIGGVIVNSADTVVISSFLGLSVLAIYNNYFYILSSIIGFIAIIFNSCVAGIGNSLVTETAEKNYNDFKIFTLLIVWLAGVCSCCLLCLYQPFMLLWLRDKTFMFGMTEVLCLCSYFFVYELASMMIQYKDAAGIWHEDRFRPLVTALANLAMNLISVQYIGIIGVLLSTVISFSLIGIPWLVHNIFSLLFKCSPVEYIKKLFMYIIVTVLAGMICYNICSLITFVGWFGLFLRAGICCVVPNMIFFIAYHQLREFEQAKELILRLISKIR